MNARMTRRTACRGLAATFVAAASMPAASYAYADDFHGFDPTTFDGAMLSADKLQAMAADASKAAPPRNGKKLALAFANLAQDISFCVKVADSIRANAAAAGIDLVVADNHLDGATALQNAQSFLQRNVDFVIEFQTDANFGQTIMQQMDDAKTKVIAIDIPMPGAKFFGANNPRSGFMGGAYLGQSAIAKFGADKVKQGYFVVGELPQSGAIPAMRTNGQIAGFMAAADGFDPSHLIKIDTKNVLEESFTQMTNVLGRIPSGVPIMVTAINDQATIGMIRAVKQGGREADLIAVGMGADEIQTMVAEPTFVASVGYFPERYGNYLIPMALMQLAGKQLPDTVLVHHVMVSKDNVCKYYDTTPCQSVKEIDYIMPQDRFEQHLAEIRKLPDLKNFQNLIPSN